ncbi:MAG: ATPase, T2SS/T4P/T4SS family [Candidatus Kariarchaeaceae archaeon]
MTFIESNIQIDKNSNLNLNHVTLPSYEVNYQIPTNFEHLIIQLQHNYIELKRNIRSSPSSFISRLKTLEVLATNLFVNGSPELDYHLLSWGTLNLTEVYLLFKDKLIFEIYLNEINTPIIVNHRLEGKLKTNLVFSDELWHSLKIQSELNSNQIISRLNPSLKTGLVTTIGNMRITLQIPPLSLTPTVVIRRLPTHPITSNVLIEENQINYKQMNFLINSIKLRKNIIISGEPGSGKTTLANALLLESPVYWRMIILEDASEVILPTNKFPMAVKYSIPSVGKISTINRGEEISKLLHRSPDYVFLGEIQDYTDTRTMFEAFASGIKGLATTHSYNFEGLRSRWVDNYEIKTDMIGSIDVIVITKKEWKGNKLIFNIDSVMSKCKNGFRRIE